MKKTLDDLKSGDYIAFGFNYNGGEPNDIIIDNITSVYDDRVLVHFLYGYKSMAEFILKKDIIAIGDLENGESKIPHCSGKFNILLPDHPLLNEKI